MNTPAAIMIINDRRQHSQQPTPDRTFNQWQQNKKTNKKSEITVSTVCL